jgi:hypothetical protein
MFGIENRVISHILGIGLKSLLIFSNITFISFSLSILFEFLVKLIQEIGSGRRIFYWFNFFQ